MAEQKHLVADWFGPAFALLHPRLRALHDSGGALRGPCRVEYGSGLAGLVGKLLARRLGIVESDGGATLCVKIASDAGGLLWSRRFNDGPVFASHFQPVGRYPDGYWVERSGAVTLRFGVEVIEGAWHWRQQRLSWRGVPLSGRLMPRTIASKAVSGDAYVFCVAVRVPVLGTVLSYRGQLALCDSLVTPV